MAGATQTGFIKKSFEEIKQELETRARLPEFFGSTADLSAYSPLGQIVSVFALVVSENWEYLEYNYYNSYLDTATGVNLDRLGKLVGITRKPALPETVILQFAGSEYTIIPTGFQIQTLSGIIYQTTETKSITGGLATVQASAVNTGTISRVASAQLTEFVTPISGLDTVTNPDASSGGAVVESDADYRTRIQNSVGFIKNSGAINYIKLKMEEASFVSSIFIQENSLPTEQNGIPANSLAFTVQGGTDLEVATLIYTLKPAGVRTVGTETVSVPTGFGDSQTIQFSRPSYLDIYARIEIEKDSYWVVGSETQIKTSIVQYIGGVDTIDGETTEYKGLGIGKRVISWQAFGYIKVSGIVNLTILFGTSPIAINQTTVNVTNSQIARIATANIEVVLL